MRKPDIISLYLLNGSRYYRALESVSTASALSSALTIYRCQISESINIISQMVTISHQEEIASLICCRFLR